MLIHLLTIKHSITGLWITFMSADGIHGHNLKYWKLLPAIPQERGK